MESTLFVLSVRGQRGKQKEERRRFIGKERSMDLVEQRDARRFRIAADDLL